MLCERSAPAGMGHVFLFPRLTAIVPRHPAPFSCAPSSSNTPGRTIITTTSYLHFSPRNCGRNSQPSYVAERREAPDARREGLLFVLLTSLSVPAENRQMYLWRPASHDAVRNSNWEMKYAPAGCLRELLALLAVQCPWPTSPRCSGAI